MILQLSQTYYNNDPTITNHEHTYDEVHTPRNSASVKSIFKNTRDKQRREAHQFSTN